MYFYGPRHMAVQKQDDQLELTHGNYVRTQDVTLKTCRKWWMIGRSGEWGSGISVLAARHDDDMYVPMSRHMSRCEYMYVCMYVRADEYMCMYMRMYTYIYIYIYVCVCVCVSI